MSINPSVSEAGFVSIVVTLEFLPRYTVFVVLPDASKTATSFQPFLRFTSERMLVPSAFLVNVVITLPFFC